MDAIIFCVVIALWLFGTGLFYRFALKHEYDNYGLKDWLHKGSDPDDNKVKEG